MQKKMWLLYSPSQSPISFVCVAILFFVQYYYYFWKILINKYFSLENELQLFFNENENIFFAFLDVLDH